eukprot:SAG11_NODE_2249_length_3634_cov_12.743140_3_plen_71_part_00
MTSAQSALQGRRTTSDTLATIQWSGGSVYKATTLVVMGKRENKWWGRAYPKVSTTQTAMKGLAYLYDTAR